MMALLSSLDLTRALRTITHAIVVLGFCSVISQSIAADATLEKTPKPTISSPATSEKDASGVVLATVNGRAITQAEFDAVSAFPLANIKDERLRYQAKNKILRDLIDEYLIEQTIAESKLDQDPFFKPVMERERRSATLNTYQIYTASRSPVNLTNADIDAFIRSHKEYFWDRRTYRYTQFILPPQTKEGSEYSVELIRNFITKFNQAQFMNWLIDQGIDFQRANLWQGSEQMAPALLSALSKMKAGSVLVEGIAAPSMGSSSSPNKNPEGIRVIYLIDSFPDPINADEARNSVARNLITQVNRSKISETMQELRAKAKIEILDENLKLDITNLNQADNSLVAERRTARRLEYMRTAWFFCLICLVPLALWKFFKSVPIISQKEGALQTLQTLEQSSFMRLLEALLVGSLLFFPLVRFIFERLAYYDTKVVILSAVCGISVAIALVLAIKKTALLRDLNQNRILAVTLLLLVQYLILAL